MDFLFSATTLAFYDSAMTYPNLPVDCVKIPASLRDELLTAELAGKVISADSNGYPIVADRPPLTAGQILAANTATRDALLSAAALSLAPLQDAADLGIATGAETASLTAWKQYRVALLRFDLTQASPAWPVAPVNA